MERKLLTKEEARKFAEGTWDRSFEKMGAHFEVRNGVKGCRFAVWAPGAISVRVTGTFSNWDIEKYYMATARDAGVWRLFIPGVREGDQYKYVIETKGGELIYKADPYAFYAQKPPETASIAFDIDNYKWKDKRWLNARAKQEMFKMPLNIYEVHLGTWKRNEDGTYYTYKQLAESLVPYAVEMGYTHLEIMPIMEHPFDGSWGYQTTGYYAPTSRYGTPTEFMEFIDACHKAKLGVILDWAPGHLCRDAHGLSNFIGEKLYEKDEHPNWGTFKFDIGRGEVRSFLSSNALFWVEKYHVDGIRMDGVTSMLYLNFGIDDPNMKKFADDGSEKDYNSIKFIQQVNKTMGSWHPDVMMIAEESTAWPLVTRPPEDGGLGFHFKWDMGWMHDTLNYMKTDFPYRPGNHSLLTFSMMYTFNENFILALSHDEVVHGKASLIGRMPGDYWRQFAGMRSLALYQITHPGAKHNFMGAEIPEFIEWRDYEGLEWFLLDYDAHRKHNNFVKALNALYKSEPAMWFNGYSWDGFDWIDADNAEQSILIFVRHGKRPIDDLIVLLNFTPAVYEGFRIGVDRNGTYNEIFNSDDQRWGGSGKINPDPIKSEKIESHGKKNSIAVRVPPIGGIILKRAKVEKAAAPVVKSAEPVEAVEESAKSTEPAPAET